MEELDGLHIGIVGPKSSTNFHHRKIDVEYRSPHLDDYEFPTLKMLWDVCRQRECKVFYIHTKGVSKMEKDNYASIKPQHTLRRQLEYHILWEYKKRMRELDTYDATGPFYRDDVHAHFSGNFWWANSSYVAQLNNPLVNSPTNNLDNRFHAEFWIGRKRPIANKINMVGTFPWEFDQYAGRCNCSLSTMYRERRVNDAYIQTQRPPWGYCLQPPYCKKPARRKLFC